MREHDGRGRHTTVTRELMTLPSGALLIDTPGIREAGLWDGTGGAFADIEALAARCRFTDCGHTNEPGCAVRDGGRPRARRGVAEARARAGVARGPPPGGARARAARAQLHAPRRASDAGVQGRRGVERRGAARRAVGPARLSALRAVQEVQADDAVRPRRVPRPARDVLAAQRRVRILLGHDVADLLTVVDGPSTRRGSLTVLGMRCRHRVPRLAAPRQGARPRAVSYNPRPLRARSSVGERSLHTREVAGSKPAAPMPRKPSICWAFCFLIHRTWIILLGRAATPPIVICRRAVARRGVAP